MPTNRILEIILPVLLLALLFGSVVHSAAQDVVITVGTAQGLTNNPFVSTAEEVVQAHQDAVAMVNSKGGINGKKIRIVVTDTQYREKEGIETFERIYSENPKPLAIFVDSTHLTKALSPGIGTKYKVLLGTASMSSEFAQQALYPGVFVAGPTYGDQLSMLLRYVTRQKSMAKVAFIYSEIPFGKDPIPYARLRAEKLSLSLVGEIAVPRQMLRPTKEGEMIEVSDIVEKLVIWQPDFILLHGFTMNPIPFIIEECRKRDLKSTFMATMFCMTKEMLDRLGPLAHGLIGVNPYAYWWMDEVPMIRKIKDYTARTYTGERDGRVVPAVQHRSILYMFGFTQALIAFEAMNIADRAGELHYEGIIKGLQAIKNLQTGGLIGPLTNKNNRFPVATIWNANPAKGVFEPVADWKDFHIE